MAEDPLETSITSTMADAGALDVAADAAEQALDAFLEEGPLKEISVFKYFLAAWRAPAQVRDLLFAKKIAKFYKPLQDIREAERREFVDRIEKEPDFQRRVGQHLLLIVDRLDNMAKPELLAGAFRAYVEEEISWEQFLDLSVVIDRCLVSDLGYVKAGDPAQYPPAAATQLSGCGVIEIAAIPSVRGPGAVNKYLLTDAPESQCRNDYWFSIQHREGLLPSALSRRPWPALKRRFPRPSRPSPTSAVAPSKRHSMASSRPTTHASSSTSKPSAHRCRVSSRTNGAAGSKIRDRSTTRPGRLERLEE